MSCRVVGDWIPVQQMLDGQMAVIRKWKSDLGPVGRVVQRWGDILIVLGEDSSKGYSDVLARSLPQPDCLVRVLPPGTMIEVG